MSSFFRNHKQCCPCQMINSPNLWDCLVFFSGITNWYFWCSGTPNLHSELKLYWTWRAIKNLCFLDTPYPSNMLEVSLLVAPYTTSSVLYLTFWNSFEFSANVLLRNKWHWRVYMWLIKKRGILFCQVSLCTWRHMIKFFALLSNKL